MKKDIINRLKSETNEVPDVLDKIKSHPDFFVPEPKKTFKFRPRIKYAFLSIIILIAFILVSEPVKAEATITIDINPSIQFEVNKNEKVISITGINDDGKEVIKDIKYKRKNIEEVLDRIIEAAINKKYIKEDDYILIGIESENEDFSEKVSKKVNEKIMNKLKEKNKNANVIIEKIKSTKNNANNNNKDNKEGNTESNTTVKITNSKLNLVNEVISLTDYTTQDFEKLATYKVKDLYYLIKEEYIKRIIERADYSEKDYKKLLKMNINKLEEILNDSQ